MKPWDGIIPAEEQEAYRAVGFGESFAGLWVGAWLTAWLVAFPVVLVVAPLARRTVALLVESRP